MVNMTPGYLRRADIAMTGIVEDERFIKMPKFGNDVVILLIHDGCGVETAMTATGACPNVLCCTLVDGIEVVRLASSSAFTVRHRGTWQ